MIKFYLILSFLPKKQIKLSIKGGVHMDIINLIKSQLPPTDPYDYVTPQEFSYTPLPIEIELDTLYGSIYLYRIFHGVRLAFFDLQTTLPIPIDIHDPDTICITHCTHGILECDWGVNDYFYPRTGDTLIHTANLGTGLCRLPLGRSKGVSILFSKNQISQQTIHILELISTDFFQIQDILDLDQTIYRTPDNHPIGILLSQLTRKKEMESLAYFRLKTLEIIHCTSNLSLDDHQPYRLFTRQQVTILKSIRTSMLADFTSTVTINQLCKAHGVPKALVIAFFRHRYGETPYAYLKRCKMNMAGQLLLSTDEKINDIATRLGYTNPSKFSQAFLDVMGFLPKDYRKTLKHII